MAKLTRDKEHVEVIQRVYKGMLAAEHSTAIAAQSHKRAFTLQIQQLFGIVITLPEEPYLEHEQKRFELQLLKILERFLNSVERRIYGKNTALDDILDYNEKAAFNPKNPALPQVEARVALENLRMHERMHQSLEGTRQQAIGINSYIWHSQDDARVRPDHAANDGQIFNWDTPPPTGNPGEDYNCRCWAEPVIKDAIEPIYPIIDTISLVIIKRAISKILTRTQKRVSNAQAKIQKKPVEKPRPKKPTNQDSLTEHGAQRATQRKITQKEAQDAIKTAKESGSIATKIGKYGTPQDHYTGSNGITVIIEKEGRNAGKIITIWRK
jgi:SPP1 gp7 family putative phage head morphogenesis protein